MEEDILVLDPIAIQSRMVDAITSTGILFEDPTTPLAQQVEATTASIAEISNGIINLERKLFPVMSRDMNDIYPHLIDGDEVDLFASPSTTTVRMLLEVTSLMNFGIKDDNTYRVTIPKESYVEVDGYKFMFVNDVNVKLNNKRDIYSSFVELSHDGDDIEFASIGSLNSSIIQDENNVDWIVADIPVKQLDLLIASDRLISGYTFDKEQQYTGQLHHVEVYGTNLSGEIIELKKVYSEDYFDPTTPSVFINVMDNAIGIKVDSIYIGPILRGDILVKIWSTSGKLSVNLANFTNDNFTFSIAGISDTLEKSVAYKMKYLAYSKEVVDNGVDMRDLSTVRDKIINRTHGSMNMPITEFQIKDVAELYGFDISKSIDLITERIYIATKDFTDFDYDVTQSTINMHRTRIDYNETTLDDKLIITDDYTLIKPGKLFKNDNGLIKPLTNNEKDLINGYTNEEKRTFFNNNKIFFNPFLYIVDNNVKSIVNRIYDIDRPKSDFLNIDAKNNYVNISVNIHEVHIFRVGDGYDVLISLIGNNEYNSDKENIHIQVGLKGEVSDTYYHTSLDNVKTAEYFPNSDVMHYVRIESSLFIDENNLISLTNGYNENGLRETNIKDTVSFIIYTTNENITVSSEEDAKSFLGDNDIQGTDDAEYGLSKEHSTFIFADTLDWLWNRVDNLYTKDKYIRYTEDVIATYDKDIYEKVDGRPFVIVKDDDGNCTVSKQIIHNKGDDIEDDDGNKIYIHRKGDIVYDGDYPVIDTKAGIMKYIDILMLDYKYVSFYYTKYVSHIDNIIKTLRLWTLDYMATLNNDMLEQTYLYYRPVRNNTLVIGGDDTIYDNIISPVVTIYMSEDKVFNIDIGEIHTSIGVLLNRYFSKLYIDVNKLEEEIKGSVVQDALAVNISNFSMKDDKLISLKSNSNRFEIKTTIGNDYNITYDFKLDIKTI